MNRQIAFPELVSSAFCHRDQAKQKNPMIKALRYALSQAKQCNTTFHRPDIFKDNQLTLNQDPRDLSRYYLQTVDTLADEALGALSRPLLPGTFSMLARMMGGALTLGDALKQAQEFVTRDLNRR